MPAIQSKILFNQVIGHFVNSREFRSKSGVCGIRPYRAAQKCDCSILLRNSQFYKGAEYDHDPSLHLKTPYTDLPNPISPFLTSYCLERNKIKYWTQSPTHRPLLIRSNVTILSQLIFSYLDKSVQLFLGSLTPGRNNPHSLRSFHKGSRGGGFILVNMCSVDVAGQLDWFGQSADPRTYALTSQQSGTAQHLASINCTVSVAKYLIEVKRLSSVFKNSKFVYD